MSEIIEIPPEHIRISKHHDRQDGLPDDEMLASVREHGILEPIGARPLPISLAGIVPYELIWGKRRLLAARTLDLKWVPAVLRDVDEPTARALSLVENLHRAPLPPLEEAAAFLWLQEQGESTARIAATTAKSEAYVHRRIQLLLLHADAREALAAGEISIGHADRLTRVPLDRQPAALGECRTKTVPGLFGGAARMVPAPLWHLEEWIRRHARISFTEPEDTRHYFPFLVEDREPEAVPTLLRLSESSQPGADLDEKKHGLVGRLSWVEIGSTHFDDARKKRKVKDCEHSAEGVVVHGGPVRVLRVCAKKGCPVHRRPAPKRQEGADPPGEGGPRKRQEGADPPGEGGPRERSKWEIDADRAAAERKAWEAEAPDLLARFGAHVAETPFTADLLRELLGEWGVERIASGLGEGWELTEATMGQAAIMRHALNCHTRADFAALAKTHGFRMPRKPRAKKAS